MVLLSRELIPFVSLRVVLLHSLTVFIAPAQIVLRLSEALVGGQEEPSDCFIGRFWNNHAALRKLGSSGEENFTKLPLCMGDSLLGSFSKPLNRGGIIER